jgi:DNA repair protein RecO (recombination protein O)
MQRLRTYATEGIVLRRNEYGEADWLVTLLTPDHGKLRALAKSARRLTSRKAGHIELFARTHLLLARGRTFDLITQAELIEPHRALREDVLRSAMAHYLCDLADWFAPQGSESASLYDLLVEGLGLLCRAADLRLAVRYFELRLLTLEGYRPELFRCVRTGAPVEASAEHIAFSPAEGGVLSADAVGQARDVLWLRRQELALMRLLQSQPFEALAGVSVPPELHEGIERATQSYLSAILERRPRTAALVRQLVRSLR